MRGASSILSWLDNNSKSLQAVPTQQSQHTHWSNRNPYAPSEGITHDRLQATTVIEMPQTGVADAQASDTGPSAYQDLAAGRVVASDAGGGRSAGEERDQDVIDHDDSGTFITEQPVGMLPLDYTNYVPSDTTFPNIRGPNLSKLTKGTTVRLSNITVH